MSSSELAISVRGLTKRFGKTEVVSQVSIDMPKGQVWGFLGPNGSGKTTTIRMICGLLKPSEGQGECLGLDILRDSEKIKLQTGYMTQKFSFWEDLTIKENLDFVARMYHLANRSELVDNTLKNLGLFHRKNQLAGALSGGWKQRLALAAVTMHKPKLLLLDEPTAGVDPQARREFWREIHTLANHGMTVLVSTHYMDEAERCDSIVYLANGKLITQGCVAQVTKESQLVTYRADEPNVRAISEALNQEDGVEFAAFFGSAIHVSGTNQTLLNQVLQSPPYNQLTWHQVKPSLEDVFISLMKRSGSDLRQH